MNFLAALQPGGRTNFLEAARQFISKYPQRGLLIVISDFLDDGDCESPLQYLADFGHELTLVQVWAEEDRDPPWSGELQLEDSESGQLMELAFDAEARAMYTQAFDEYAQKLRRVALRNGGRYTWPLHRYPRREAIFGPLIRSNAVE